MWSKMSMSLTRTGIRRGSASASSRLPGLQVGLPPQPVDVGGASQTLEEVVGDARRPLRLAVDVDPERLGLHQAALAPVDADPHLAPPVRRARTPAPQPQHVLELDGPDQVDHRAPHDPQRMGLLEAHLAQLIRADVLDVPGGGVELQPARRGRRRRPAAATRCRRRRGADRGRASSSWPGRCRVHPWYSRAQILPQRRNLPRTAKRAFTSSLSWSDVAKTFVGSRVRQLRSERGFSQAALAQMLDISPSYLNQIEHDVRPLTVAGAAAHHRGVRRRRHVLRLAGRHPSGRRTARGDARPRPRRRRRPVRARRRRQLPSGDGPGDGQPAPALPADDHSAGGRHRGPVLRRQRQPGRIDHDAARGGARLLLPAAELPARARHRRRGAHRPDADAPRRSGPRPVRPADRRARRAHRPANRSRATTSCTASTPRRGRSRSAVTCPSGQYGVQARRRTGLPRVRRPHRRPGRRRQLHQRRVAHAGPPRVWPTTSPPRRCCRTASSTTWPRTSATTSSACRRSTR